MTRKFFVGGNFKMNPTTVEAKRAIVKILNDAQLDSNVGALALISAFDRSERGKYLQRS
jgi:triosephosphate isomerase